MSGVASTVLRAATDDVWREVDRQRETIRDLVSRLDTIADALRNPVRPGHVAYRSKASLIELAETGVRVGTECLNPKVAA